MHYLITGANGQLGTEWQQMLSKSEHTYTAVDVDQLDITDQARLVHTLNRLQPDILINCAAYTNVDGAEEHRELAYRVNKDGVAHLAAECKHRDILLVHYSTDYVFPGRKADREELPEGYPETAETNPINVYGASKRAGEEVLMESGCEYLLIRVAWLCGAYGQNFLKTMLKLSETHDSLSIVDDQYGSPTFTAEVVANTLALLASDKRGIWHVNSEGTITWRQFAEEIFRQKKLTIKTEGVSTEAFGAIANRPRFSKLDTSKLEEVPGAVITEWQKGLKDTLETLNRTEQ